MTINFLVLRDEIESIGMIKLTMNDNINSLFILSYWQFKLIENIMFQNFLKFSKFELIGMVFRFFQKPNVGSLLIFVPQQHKIYVWRRAKIPDTNQTSNVERMAFGQMLCVSNANHDHDCVHCYNLWSLDFGLVIFFFSVKTFKLKL